MRAFRSYPDRVRPVDLAIYADMLAGEHCALAARAEQARSRIREAAIERDARAHLPAKAVAELESGGILGGIDERSARKELQRLTKALEALEQLQAWVEAVCRRSARTAMPSRPERELACGACRAWCHSASSRGAALALAVSAARPTARAPASVERGLGVVFVNGSYRPGEVAHLELWTHARSVRIQLFRAGPERRRSRSKDKMAGVPRGDPLVVRHPGRSIAVPLGRWVPGLNFARVVSSGGSVGYAPFVLRPARLGAYRVAVILPTNTWQAYNLLDVDGDGVGDTWYADPSIHVVDLRRPYVDHGVPRWYRSYNSGFVHWLAHSGYGAEILSDDDLDAIRSGTRLAHRYDLVVFAGHEDYVTPHVYNIVRRYRDRGETLPSCRQQLALPGRQARPPPDRAPEVA